MTQRTQIFQGMRLLLIMGIVCLHIGHPILGTGADICSFFFVLSGFLYNPKYNNDYKGYVIKKVKNIFPKYWFCLAIMLVALQIYRDVEWDWDIIPHILLLQTFIPSDTIPMKYLGVAWFLSDLMVCYAISPIIGKKIKDETNSFLWIIFIFVLLYSAIDLCNGNPLKTWITYLSPLYRIGEYLMGMLLAREIGNKDQQKEVHWVISLIIMALYWYSMHHLTFKNASSILHVGIIYYLYMYSSSMINLVFANKLVLFLSKYIIYVFLSHQIINVVVSYYANAYPWYIVPISFGFGTTLGIVFEKFRKMIVI